MIVNHTGVCNCEHLNNNCKATQLNAARAKKMIGGKISLPNLVCDINFGTGQKGKQDIINGVVGDNFAALLWHLCEEYLVIASELGFISL